MKIIIYAAALLSLIRCISCAVWYVRNKQYLPAAGAVIFAAAAAGAVIW